jgi:hypothetical protein
VGKKVTIKAGSLDEVDKRVAQALGNKSGSASREQIAEQET